VPADLYAADVIVTSRAGIAGTLGCGPVLAYAIDPTPRSLPAHRPDGMKPAQATPPKPVPPE